MRPAARDRDVGPARSDTGASKLAWLLPLGFAGLLVLLYFVWPDYRTFVDEGWRVARSGDRQQLSQWVRSLGPSGPIAIYALAVAQTVLFAVPSLLVTVAAMLAYGPLLGTLLAWSALLVSAPVAWGVGRALGPVAVDKLIGETGMIWIGAVSLAMFVAWVLYDRKLSEGRRGG